MTGALVVNADDFGVSRGATLGIVRAHQEGVVTSTSLTTTTEDYAHARRCLDECPELGVGLHFTLTAGRPVSPPREVPLLIDQRGFLRWRFGSLFRALWRRQPPALLEQIAIELEAQLDRLSADGVEIDHIDSERHVHLIPDLFELVAAAAVRREIPFIRMGADVGRRLLRAEHLPTVLADAGFIKLWLLSGLTRRNRPHAAGVGRTAGFASYLYSGRLDLVITDLVQTPPGGGITEVMVHPGIPEESHDIVLGNPGLERYLRADDRRKELEACIRARDLTSPETLTSFRALARSEGRAW